MLLLSRNVEYIMYNVIICEENKSANDFLDCIIRSFFISKGLKFRLRNYKNPEKVLKYSEKADIVFLDIDSDREMFFDLAKNIKKQNPDIYLYIISDELSCLDDAMDLKVFRYIPQKPDIRRIIASLNTIVYLNNKVSFMSNYTKLEMKEAEIACIFSKDRKTYVLTENGDCYPTTISIKHWLKKITDSKHFIQPHYSYIVNRYYICDFDGKVITIRFRNGDKMEIYPSQRRLSQIRRILWPDKKDPS